MKMGTKATNNLLTNLSGHIVKQLNKPLVTKHLALFTGPAQFSITCSTEKCVHRESLGMRLQKIYGLGQLLGGVQTTDLTSGNSDRLS